MEEITGGNHWDLSVSAGGDAAGGLETDPGSIAGLLTGQLLESLHVLPDATTLACLSVPGNPQLNIGHRLLCGSGWPCPIRVLAPVASNSGGKTNWRASRPVTFRSTAPGIQVRGWLVFRPMEGTPVLVNNRAAGESRWRPGFWTRPGTGSSAGKSTTWTGWRSRA